MAKYTPEEIKKISEKVSVIDYFQYLERQGKVKFDRKYGSDYYFKTESNKFSVSEDRFYDFKNGTGGKIIKAVMLMENKSWKDSLDFLREFSNTAISSDLKKEFAEKRNKIDRVANKNKHEPKIIRSIIPNNRKLLKYFENRGISKEVLKANTRQIHYDVNGKKYFGIGLQNESKGYEIRNPLMKSKIGQNNYTLIPVKNAKEMIVFEGMTDMLSFLELLKNNNKENNRTLVCLNSVTNIDKFIEDNKDFKGKKLLLLDGDEAGNTATQKALKTLDNAKDIRPFYNIKENGNNDLNDYLKKKSQYKNISNENATSEIKQRGISNSQSMGTGTPKQDINPISSKNQSKQVDRASNPSRNDLFGTNVRNGLTGSEKLDAGLQRGARRNKTTSSNRTGAVGNEGSRKSTPLETTNIPKLDNLIKNYKGQKLTNEQVAELVSVACFVDNNKVVQLQSNLNITEDLKELVSQYKTGGVAKKGRGVLDEYYTNIEIVNAVKNLINKELKEKENLSILEPSVGIGNFINAVKDLPNAKINTFEINETTAKISKILYPGINVNLRSFETEFITNNGIKQHEGYYSYRYDLVIGNPPYGDHRGFYKGLGEEPKISKYEDYFVKRSLDSIGHEGIVAMVLPSGWLNRQKKLNNAELVNAYRLPVGAFAGTQVGTDIVLLRKDNRKQNIDISNYFKENPNKVLGEIREKTNRFGRLEEYVHGDLKEALAILERELKVQKEKVNIDVQKKWNDYKELYKEAIIDSDSWKYDMIDQNLNRFDKDIVFNNIFSEILEQNKNLNADLYDKYHNDRKFANTFFNEVRALCFRTLRIKEKTVSSDNSQIALENIKSNKVYQEILKDSFGGVMYNLDNVLKYDKEKVLELLELWDKVKPAQQEMTGGITKGVIDFAKDIIGEQNQKQHIVDTPKDYKVNSIDAKNITNDELEMIIKVLNQKGKEIKALDVIEWFFEEKNNIPKETREIIYEAIEKNNNRIQSWKEKTIKATEKTPSLFNVDKKENKPPAEPTLFDAINENKQSIEYPEHYSELKKRYPNTLLLFENKQDYVSYGDDAKILAKILKLRLTENDNKASLKFPYSLLDSYLKKLNEEKISVAITTQLNNKREVTLTKVEIALQNLEEIKIKPPAIIREIQKYQQLEESLKNKTNNYTDTELDEIIKKADKIVASRTRNNKSEYETQKTPNIKKGVLKYQFLKEDKIVDSSLQNNSNISDEELEAFKDTQYNGILNKKEKHSKYANYIAGNWMHDFYYAEGNIYEKLKQLERDKHAIEELQYQKQKTLLKSVLPKPKKLNEIIISPNHEFVHKFKLGEREVEKRRQVYGQYGGINWETYTEIEDFTLADKFKDFVHDLPSKTFKGSSYWEVSDFVDNVTVTGSDRERNALVRERRKEVANDLFQKFIDEEMTDAEKEKFVHDFNRNYNNIHIPNYSNFPLFSKIYQNFKGRPLRLAEVQKAGVGRLTTKGVGGLAHEVGFGKTLSGVLAVHEAMQRGTAKRPLIVVPNDSILKQWFETIFEVIPNAKVNVLSNLGKNYDLDNFENNDNEITLVTYSGFNNIGFNKQITDHLASKFSYISENELKVVKNSDDSIIIKNESEREKQKRIAQKDELKGKIKKGKVYDWEDFGFDHLTFDEVHNANHIVGKVKIEDRRFASDFRSQNQRTSALGINTWVASQYIQENYNGRNVTLLSATPFTNKPLEYYSILSLIANNRLEEKGYFNVNTFFETFMEADNEMEIDAKGEVSYKANVKRFKNNAIFQQLLGEFIDIKGEEDNPELIRPNRINKEYKIKQNDLTKEQYELLNENYSDEDKGAILTHILNARLTAISPYLSPFYENKLPTVKGFIENSPKLDITMKLIAQNKKDNPKAGQIIYSELAVNEFPKLKEYLVEEIGFKDKEVAIITGKTSKLQRQNIQQDFNDGKIKVIIGSSAIQEGMNLQENTSDMYLLSLPYNFTSLRQTEGRAWRQGNKFENVRINYMLTEDSIDVFMLQKLQAKQSRYLEAMKKDVNILDISDIDTQELKTALITNSVTRAEIEIKMEKRRLESEKTRLIADSSFMLRKYENVIAIQDKIATTKKEMKNHIEWSSEEADANANYWTKEVTKDKFRLNQLSQELKEEIYKLEKTGIDVSAIDNNVKLTDKKVDEIDKKIDQLPILREELIQQYEKEQDEKNKQNNHIDFVEERANENQSFYKLREVAEEKNQEKTRGFRR